MSNKFSSLAVVAALLTLPMSQLFAQGNARKGARVVLWLHNQHEMAGRLLSVRDSALVISTSEARDNHSDARTADIRVVKNQNIRRVIVKGESQAKKGAGLGFLIGAGTGAIIGLAAGDDEPCPESTETWSIFPNCWSLSAGAKAAIGGIVLGSIGAAVGGIVGTASKADKSIYPSMNHDFSALKPYAQFPEKEPEYLSAIK